MKHPVYTHHFVVETILICFLQKFWKNFKLEHLAKIFKFLPKHGNYELLFSSVNVKKLSIHTSAQRCRCSFLNWMGYPKYRWCFWSISWLSHKLTRNTKLSTIARLPYLFIYFTNVSNDAICRSRKVWIKLEKQLAKNAEKSS